jgi:hypothetical protein
MYAHVLRLLTAESGATLPFRTALDRKLSRISALPVAVAAAFVEIPGKPPPSRPVTPLADLPEVASTTP